jgi:hypothetical protein
MRDNTEASQATESASASDGPESSGELVGGSPQTGWQRREAQSPTAVTGMGPFPAVGAAAMAARALGAGIAKLRTPLAVLGGGLQRTLESQLPVCPQAVQRMATRPGAHVLLSEKQSGKTSVAAALAVLNAFSQQPRPLLLIVNELVDNVKDLKVKLDALLLDLNEERLRVNVYLMNTDEAYRAAVGIGADAVRSGRAVLLVAAQDRQLGRLCDVLEELELQNVLCVIDESDGVSHGAYVLSAS